MKNQINVHEHYLGLIRESLVAYILLNIFWFMELIAKSLGPSLLILLIETKTYKSGRNKVILKITSSYKDIVLPNKK